MVNAFFYAAMTIKIAIVSTVTWWYFNNVMPTFCPQNKIFVIDRSHQKMKKIGLLVTILLAGCTLSACSNNASSKNKSRKNASAKVATHHKKQKAKQTSSSASSVLNSNSSSQN